MSFVTRQLPTTEELRAQLLEDHRTRLKCHQQNGVLTTFCRECITSPRSLILALEWVRTHGPFLHDLYQDLSPKSLDALERARVLSPQSDMSRELAWCIREDDHSRAAQSDEFSAHADRHTHAGISMESLLDLTFLPEYDEADLLNAQYEMRSSTNRPYASRKWKGRGISRPQGNLNTQGFWISSGIPLAQRLRATVTGRKWASYTKESDPIPNALWSAIVDMWKARYPQRVIPLPTTLRLRLTPHLPK